MLGRGFTLKQALAATEEIAADVDGYVHIQVDKEEIVPHEDTLRLFLFVDRQERSYFVRLNRIEDNILLVGRFTDEEVNELIETDFQSDHSVLTTEQISAIDQCSKDILTKHLESLNEIRNLHISRLLGVIEEHDKMKLEAIEAKKSYETATDESSKKEWEFQIKNRTRLYELLYGSCNYLSGRIADLNDTIDKVSGLLSALNDA